MSSRNLLTTALAAVSLAGCLPGLAVVPIKSTSGKPSNVAVYFTVDTHEGKPVPSLTADQFTVFEDGAKLAAADTQQTLLSPKLAAAHYTLILVDMSGSVVGAKEVGALIKAASSPADHTETPDQVAIYTFDGSPELSQVVPFATEAPVGADGATKAKDVSSTTLSGAVLLGVKALKSALDAEKKPLKSGTLIVFTEGTDRPGRVSPFDLRLALAAPDNAAIDVFAVGLGTANAAKLDAIGKSGTVVEPDPTNVTTAYDAVLTKLAAKAARYYLLSYCTPARAGFHDLRVEAHTPDGLIGDLTYRFNADGFAAGCDPSAPPGFAPPEAPPVVEKKKDPPKKPAKRAHPSPSPASEPAPPPAPAADPFAP